MTDPTNPDVSANQSDAARPAVGHPLDVAFVPYAPDYDDRGSSPTRLIPSIIEEVVRNERLGFSRMWAGEVNADAMLPLMLAAEHTTRLELGTAIVTAFPRSPMHLAAAAHDLQLYSKGRFTLGLGSQVKAHVERRFGGVWDRPVARMSELIQALRAIWSCWNEGTRLAFEGEFYRHTLMTPAFAPPPSAFGPPPVFVAAVGPAMTEMAAGVADGLITHGLVTRSYLRDVILPKVDDGLAAAGRPRAAFQVTTPALVATGRDDEELEANLGLARSTLAFYCSTPAYRRVLEHHGWGELQSELNTLIRQGSWSELSAHVPDEVLDAFVLIGPPKQVASGLHERLALVDRVTFSPIPGSSPALAEHVLDAMAPVAAG